MATGQSVVYQVTIAEASAMASFARMEGAAMSFERSLAGINTTLAGIGLALGARAIFDFGKNMVQSAADYENAMLRIKFSSKSLEDGLRNQSFILGEVDKFKIPLQEATDAYGKFLAMVGSSHLAGDEIRKLHDNLLMVAKIKHVTDAQMGRAVYDLGALIGEPRMDAQHLRFLSYALPGIMPYVAKENNITMEQLAEMIKKRKTGDLDHNSVIRAVEDMAKDLGGNLPEALKSLQSNINELDNAWLELKNDITLQLKPELISLFQSLEHGVKYLKEHEEAVIRYGEGIANLIRIWIEYKLVMGAINGLAALTGAAFGTQATAITTETGAMAGLNAEMVLMNINLETMIALMADLNLAGGGAGIGMAGLAGGVLSRQAASGAFGLPIKTGASGSGANIGTTIVNGAMMVGLSFIGLEALESLNNMFSKKAGDEGYKFKWTDAATDPYFEKSKRAGASQGNHELLQNLIDQSDMKKIGVYNKGEQLFNYIKIIQGINEKNGEKRFDLIKSLIGVDDYGRVGPHTNADLYDRLKGLGYNLPKMFGGKDTTGGDGSGDGGKQKVVPARDHVTGQRVITYNIKIMEMNGQKIATQQVNGTQSDTRMTGDQLARMLESVVNDTEIHGND